MRIGRAVTPASRQWRAHRAAILLSLVLWLALPTFAGGADCTGDCNGDETVRVDELVVGTRLALSTGTAPCNALDVDGNGSVTIDELVIAVAHALNGCPTQPTPTPVGLGSRRFSIEAGSSPLLAVLRQGKVASSLPGFTGFLELSAGAPDPESGLAFIDVIDSSEFISIDIPEQQTALCIKPIREQFPIVHAGFIACNGGVPVGLKVGQDHRLGEVGRCTAGSGGECLADADCDEGMCFDIEECGVADGRVEGPSDPHPGVCNGPVRGEPLSSDSGPGAVLILPDPIGGLIRGLPVEIASEKAVPCGDEGAAGMTTEIALTSGIVRVEVSNVDNQPAQTLNYQVPGENFSCASWQEEDGPGTLVLGLPGLDVPAVNDRRSDLITFFVWDD